MTIYELKHLFFYDSDSNELVFSPKKLGLFYSYEAAHQAIKYYCTQSGFRENQDAFSISKRDVIGDIIDSIVFETFIYIHSIDYEVEYEIELGFYGHKELAEEAISKYCNINNSLISTKLVVVEKMINKILIGEKWWLYGFVIDK